MKQVSNAVVFNSACHKMSRQLEFSGNKKNKFLIYEPKHMLWALKRTISMRCNEMVLLSIQTNVKTDGKKISQFYNCWITENMW